MSHETVSVRTADGDCPVYVFTPQASAAKGEGAWPAVIYYMDALAVRPSVMGMAQRMADYGYVVLVPDLFYRVGAYEPLVPTEVFALPDPFAVIGKMYGSTNPQKAAEDTAAYIAYLDSRSDVKGSKIATTGYCMGGTISLTVAATYPERVAAAASFHAGNLATDADTSPHKLAPKMKGVVVYVAGADQDAHYPPEMAAKVEAALTEAGVDHLCEIYAGAKHGWTQTDFPIYNPDAEERHWTELTGLLKRTVG